MRDEYSLLDPFMARSCSTKMKIVQFQYIILHNGLSETVHQEAFYRCMPSAYSDEATSATCIGLHLWAIIVHPSARSLVAIGLRLHCSIGLSPCRVRLV